MASRKIEVAIVKFGGMSAGGTEKFLQNIAAYLDKERFSVTFFYCDAAPYLGSNFVHPDTDNSRVSWLEENGVSVTKFKVGAKDIRRRDHPWVDTDFWEVFDETRFDVLQTARAGHPEFPFNRIRKIPIVDSIHLNAGVHNQPNIAAVMSLSEWSRSQWVRRGGDPKKSVLVSHPIPDRPPKSYPGYGSKDQTVVYGMHQRPSDDIFSPIPLRAYARIENPKTRFLLMGGSIRYVEQAADLGLKSFRSVAFSSRPEDIDAFLDSLDVYAHGRNDGEVNSTAIAEALRAGLPVISHHSAFNVGHREIVSRCGVYAMSLDDYIAGFVKLAILKNRITLGEQARELFLRHYEQREQMRLIESIYSSVSGSKPVQSSRLEEGIRECRGMVFALVSHLARPFREAKISRQFSERRISKRFGA